MHTWYNYVCHVTTKYSVMELVVPTSKHDQGNVQIEDSINIVAPSIPISIRYVSFEEA